MYQKRKNVLLYGTNNKALRWLRNQLGLFHRLGRRRFGVYGYKTGI